MIDFTFLVVRGLAIIVATYLLVPLFVFVVVKSATIAFYSGRKQVLGNPQTNKS